MRIGQLEAGLRSLRSRFARSQYSHRKPSSFLERLNRRGDSQHRKPHGRQPVALVGPREQFGFDDARPIRQSEKPHRLAGIALAVAGR